MVAIVSGNGVGLLNSSASVLGQEGVFGNAANGKSKEGVYVNIANGNLTLQAQDDYLASVGTDVALTRTYNSLGSLSDGASASRKLGFAKQIRLSGTYNTVGSRLERTNSDSSISWFTFDAARNLYVTTEGGGAYQTIIKDGNGDWLWRDGGLDSAGVQEAYDPANGGRLKTVGDAMGIRLRYFYNTAGLISHIIDSSNETTTFVYNSANLLTGYSLTLSGRATPHTRVTYGYDANQRLSTVTTDLTPDNLIDAATYTTTYQYQDTLYNRIGSVSQSDGTRLAFSYSTSGVNAGKIASITDANGNQTTFDYSVAGKTSVKDANGKTTEYSYDSAGRLISAVAPSVSGASIDTRFTYDAMGNVASMKETNGVVTYYGYDANGNRTLERDSAGLTIKRTFELVGNKMLTETHFLVADPDGSGTAEASVPLTTRMAYDSKHRLRFEITAQGRVTEYRYNTQGARESTIRYNTNFYDASALGESAAPAENTLAFWVANSVDRSKSTRVDYGYDGRGLLSTETSFSAIDAAGNGIAAGSSVTTYVYDHAGMLRKTIDGEQHATSYVYDGLGRLVTSTDAANYTTTTTWTDVIGKPSQEVSNGAVGSLTTTKTYDAAGRVSSAKVSHSGGTTLTSYYYDANGNLIRTEDSNKKLHQWYYDDAGRKTFEVDETGAVTENIYNAKDQIVRVNRYTVAAGTDIGALRNGTALGKSEDRDTVNNYDSAGRLSATMDDSGKITSYIYDGASRLVQVIVRATPGVMPKLGTAYAQQVDIVAVASALDHVTRMFYDKDSKLVGTLDADGYLTENIYNAGGQLVDTVGYATVTTAALRAAGTLDALRPAAVPLKDIHQRKLYDSKNQLVGSIDGENYLTELSYDRAGNISSRTRYATAVSAPAGATLASVGKSVSSDDQTTVYTYTERNALLTETAPDGTVTKNVYDERGRLILVQRGLGAADQRDSRVRYNDLGQVIAELSAEGAKLVAALAPGADAEPLWTAHAVRHTYDVLGRRSSSTDQLGQRTLFYYDAMGRVSHTINANGEVKEQVYNNFGEVQTITEYATRIDKAQLFLLSGGAVTADLTGMLATLSNANGYDRIQTFSYDGKGRLVTQFDGTRGAASDPLRGGYTTRIEYDVFGNVKRRTFQDLLGNDVSAATYEYDNRGNLTRTLPFGKTALASATEYDAFGRPTALFAANGTGSTTEYDRAGRVVSTRNNGIDAPSRITYDAFNRVLTQTDAIGTGVTTYTYDTKLRSMTMTTAEGVKHTTIKNRFGQTVSVTDSQGNATTFEYDKDGALLKQSDALGVELKKDYDRAGLLASSTDANGKVTSYTYDAASRVLTKTLDKTGLNLSTSFTYDALGRVATMTDARGIVTQTTYDKTGQVASVIVDTAGQRLTTTYSYDSRGNRLKVTDPSGRVTDFTYGSADFDKTSIVDAGGAGQKVLQRYDASGRNVILRVSGADGSAAVRYVYNSADQLEYEMSAEGVVTYHEYDKEQRLVRVTQYANPSKLPASAAPQAIFAAWQIKASLSADPARDAVTTTVYDKDGRVFGSVDPSGTVIVNLKFDSEGRVTERRTYATALSAPLGANPTPDSLKAAIAAAGLDYSGSNLRERMVYDARGRLVANLTGGASANLWTVRSQKYDANNNVISRTSFSKQMVSNDPAAAEIAAWVADVNNIGSSDSDVRMVYDAANRMVGSATVMVGAQGALAREWSFAAQEFDRNGNVVRRTASIRTASVAEVSPELILNVANGAFNHLNDAHTRMVYDSANRLVISAVAQGPNAAGVVQWAVTRQVYDKAGNVVARTEYATLLGAEKLAAMADVYNPASWTIPSSDADRVSRLVYDNANRLLYSIDPSNSVTQRVYDARGNVTQVTQFATPWGAASLPSAAMPPQADATNDHITRTIYDRDNRAALSIDASGAVTERVYDALGNAVKTIRYATALDAQTRASLPVTVNPGDARFTALSANNQNRIERSVFDTEGRPLYAVDAGGYFKSYTYDAIGRVISTSEFTAPVVFQEASLVADLTAAAVANAADARVTNFFYDAQGNVVFNTNVLGTNLLGNTYERFTYDGLGRKLSFTNRAGATWNYSYDAAGRMIRELAPELTVSADGFSIDTITLRPQTLLVYDALGNLTSRTEAAGQANQRVTSYQYDAVGRQVRTIFPQVPVYDATENAQQNGPAGNAVRAEKNAVPMSEVTYDAFGNAVANKDVSGYRSFKLYDVMGRVRNELDANGYLTGYERDTFGNVIALTRYSEPLPAASVGTVASVVAATLLKNPAGRVIFTEHDAMNRAVRVLQPLAYTYDANEAAGEWAKVNATHYNAFGEADAQEVYGENADRVHTSQSATTKLKFDQRGNLMAQWSVYKDTEGYLTTMEYDYAGNMTRQVEYNAAVNNWNRETPNKPVTKENARETVIVYDRFKRKVSETKLGVEYYDANTLAQQIAPVTTNYRYDTVGNLVSTTDALGQTSYTYYNVLGQVTAVAGPGTEMRTQVVQLYLALTKRAPTLNEMNSWVDAMKKGTTTRQVAEGLLSTPEGQAAYPASLSNDEFLTALCTTTRNNINPAEGRPYWLGVLAGSTRGATAADLVDALMTKYGAFGLSISGRAAFIGKVETALKAIVTSEADARLSGLGTLTEFKLDVHGNTVQRTEYAGGALMANNLTYTALNLDPANNRISKTFYDLHGHATVNIDAEQKQSYTSYDIAGRVAKQWRTVTDHAGNQKTAYLVNVYDGNGQLVETRESGNNGVALRRGTGYNAFGELTSRSLNGSAYEYTNYDNAGRAWRTNAGDGVNKVSLYDVAGNVTAVLRHADFDLSKVTSAQKANEMADVLRTETRYDLLGHVTSRIMPAQTVTSGTPSALLETSLAIRSMEGMGTIIMTSQDGKGTYETEVPDGSNKLTLSWMEMSKFGSGDVKVDVVYRTTENGGMSQVEYTASKVYGSLEAANGIEMSWSEPKKPLDSIVRITVSKKDINGRWVAIMKDRATFGGAASKVLRIAAPLDISTNVVLRYRAVGASDWNDVQNMPNFGDAMMFDASALGEGNYEYEVWHNASNGTQFGSETGTLSISSSTVRQEVAALYVSLLNRLPDAAGLRFWTNALQTNTTALSIAKQMMGGKEGSAVFPPSDTNAQFIDRFYSLAFKRTLPEIDRTSAGAALATLNAKYKSQGESDQEAQALARAEFALDLIKTTGSYVGPDSLRNADGQLLGNRVTVAMHYAATLGGGNYATAIALMEKVTATDTTAAIAAADGAVVLEKQRARVASLYIALYNRAPDDYGMTSWVNRLTKPNADLNAVVREFMNNDEAAKLFSAATDNAGFVKQLYANLLGRQPNAAELSAALKDFATREAAVVAIVDRIADYKGNDQTALDAQNLLSNKMAIGLTYAVDMKGIDLAVAAAILANVTADASATAAADANARLLSARAEATKMAGLYGKAAAAAVAALPLEKKRALIAELFVAFLNRAPTFNEVGTWVINLSTGTNEATMVQNLLDSDEGQALYPRTSSNEQFVTSVYKIALARVPDAEGLDFWTKSAVRYGRGGAGFGLIEALIRAKNPGSVELTSQNLFNNKVAVALTYAVDMGGNDKLAARTIIGKVSATSTKEANDAIDSAMAEAAFLLAKEGAEGTARAAEEALKYASANALLLKAAQDAALAEAAATAPGIAQTMRFLQIYVALYQRAPDIFTMEAARSAIAAKTGPVELVQIMLDKPELQKAYPSSLSARDFITAVYVNVLGRMPDESGLDFWSKVAADPKQGRATAAYSIILDILTDPSGNPKVLESKTALTLRVATAMGELFKRATDAVDTANAKALEANTAYSNAALDAKNANLRAAALSGVNQNNVQNRLKVVQIYVAALNRAPTPRELHDGTNLLGGSTTPAQLAATLLATAEGLALFPSTLDSNAFITRLYERMQGRSPDPEGLAFWSLPIDSATEDQRAAVKGRMVADIVTDLVGNTNDDPLARTSQRLFDANVSAAVSAVQKANDEGIITANAARQAALDAAQPNKAAEAAAKLEETAALERAGKAREAMDAAMKNEAAALHLKMIRLAVAMLGRAPTISELEQWVGMVQADPKSYEDIKRALAESEPWKSTYPATLTSVQFVTKFYGLVLGREPDPAGLKFWSDVADTRRNALQNVAMDIIDAVLTYNGTHTGAVGSQQLFDQHVADASRAVSIAAAKAAGDAATAAGNAATDALNAENAAKDAAATAEAAGKLASGASDELKARTTEAAAQVIDFTRMALTMLGRAPTLAEFNSWRALMKTGTKLVELRDALTGSKEWNERYPASLSNEGFIREVYQNVVGRAPDAAGLRFWGDALGSTEKPRTRQDILKDIVLDVSEYRQATAQKDLDILRDSAELAQQVAGTPEAQSRRVALLYTVLLGRSPNQLAIIENGPKTLTDAGMVDFVNRVLSMPETVGKYSSDNMVFFNQVFTSAMGREAPANIMNHYRELFAQGYTRGQLVWKILNENLTRSYTDPLQQQYYDFLQSRIDVAMGKVNAFVTQVKANYTTASTNHALALASQQRFNTQMEAAAAVLKKEAIDVNAAAVSRLELARKEAADWPGKITELETKAELARQNANTAAKAADASRAAILAREPSANNRLLVVQLYAALLDRAPTIAELNVALANLANPLGGLGQTAQAILAGPEGRGRFGAGMTKNQFISKFYDVAMGRPADPAGARYWFDNWSTNQTEGDIAVEILKGAVAYVGTDPLGLYSQQLLLGKLSAMLAIVQAAVPAATNSALDAFNAADKVRSDAKLVFDKATADADKATEDFRIADGLAVKQTGDVTTALNAASVAAKRTLALSRLYVALVPHDPDQSGFTFWLNAFNNVNGTEAEKLAYVANQMLATAEPAARYPSNSTPEQFITNVYKFVHDRTPEPEGMTFWLNELKLAGASRGSVLAKIIDFVTVYDGPLPYGASSRSQFEARVAGVMQVVSNAAANSITQLENAKNTANSVAGQAGQTLSTAYGNLTTWNENKRLAQQTLDSVRAAGELAQRVAAIPDAQSRRVAMLYTVLLGRAPEQAAVAGGAQLTLTDAGMMDYINGILTSAEAAGKYPADNMLFFKQVFKAAMGSDAQQNVLDLYSQKFAEGYTRQRVVWKLLSENMTRSYTDPLQQKYYDNLMARIDGAMATVRAQTTQALTSYTNASNSLTTASNNAGYYLTQYNNAVSSKQAADDAFAVAKRTWEDATALKASGATALTLANLSYTAAKSRAIATNILDTKTRLVKAYKAAEAVLAAANLSLTKANDAVEASRASVTAFAAARELATLNLSMATVINARASADAAVTLARATVPSDVVAAAEAVQFGTNIAAQAAAEAATAATAALTAAAEAAKATAASQLAHGASNKALAAAATARATATTQKELDTASKADADAVIAANAAVVAASAAAGAAFASEKAALASAKATKDAADVIRLTKEVAENQNAVGELVMSKALAANNYLAVAQRMQQLTELTRASAPLSRDTVAAAKNLADTLATSAVALKNAATKVLAAAQSNAAAGSDLKIRTDVTKAYLALLGRAPDLNGFNSAVATLKRGDTMLQLVTWMLDASETMERMPASMSATEFVTKLYTSLQGSAPDSRALDKWVAAVAKDGKAATATAILESLSERAGTNVELASAQQAFNVKLNESLAKIAALTKDSLLPQNLAATTAAAIAEAVGVARREAAKATELAVAESADGKYSTQARQIAELYVSLLGRAPSADDFFAKMINLVDKGSLETIAQQLLDSPEARLRFPVNMAPADFVKAFYQQALGRAPETGGLEYYTGRMQKTGSQAQTVVEMISSLPGYAGPLAFGLTSQHLFQDKVITALEEVNKEALTNSANWAQIAKRAADVAAVALALASKPIASVAGAGALQPGGLVSKTAAANRVTPVIIQTSDRWGNVLSVTDARDAKLVTNYAYNANNQMVSVKTPEVRVSFKDQFARPEQVFYFDKLGRNIGSRDANNNLNRSEFNAAGQIVAERHADGGVVRNTYNVFGERTVLTDADNHTTKYEYDHLGRMVSTSTDEVDVYVTDDQRGDMKAHLDTVLGARRSLKDTFRYDELGRRIESVNGNGEKMKMAYDFDGNLTSVVNGLGYVTTTTFDAFHHKTAVIDGEGRAMTWEVDSFGKVRWHQDLSGTRIDYSYNWLNQLDTQVSGEHRLVGKDVDYKVKQELSYKYANGQLVSIVDSGKRNGKDGTTLTSYAYDLAGNRVLERTIATDPESGKLVVVQDNHIRYDALGRMQQVVDGRFNVEFSYDLNGNRTRVVTQYTGDTDNAHHETHAYNRFDEMNRVTLSNGTVNAEQAVVADDDSHTITYYASGKRLTDAYTYIDSNTKQPVKTEEKFWYDNAGRLDHVTQQVRAKYGSGMQEASVERRYYDAASRVVSSGPQSIYGQTPYEGMPIAAETRTYAYNAAGEMTRLKLRNLKEEELDDLYYISSAEKPNGGYDKTGALQGYMIVPRDDGDKTYMDSHSVYFDSVKEISSTATRKLVARTTTSYYDGNGYIYKVSDNGALDKERSYFNDAAGRVLLKKQGDILTRSLIVNGEMLGSVDSSQKTTVGMADTYDSATSSANSAAPSVYNTQNGDTLRTIAKAVWGDSALWYLIADANGLSSDEVKPGIMIKLPSRVNTVHSDYNTFKPYNASDAIGSTMPTLPTPAADKGCGTVGMIAMIIVAVVVTYFTAGAAAGWLATSMPTLFAAGGAAGAAAATAAGLAVAGNTAALVIGGAIAGAASSLASQIVGVGMGMQESINWKGVALSALGGGITGGLGSVANAPWYQVASQAAASNLITQGIGVATGLQEHFSWRGVTAAFAAGAVSSAVGDKLSGSADFKEVFGTSAKFAGSVASNFAGGTAAAVMQRGHISIKKIAVDAFGNALGNSLADSMKQPMELPPKATAEGKTFFGPDGKLRAEFALPTLESRGKWNWTPEGEKARIPLVDRLFGGKDAQDTFEPQMSTRESFSRLGEGFDVQSSPYAADGTPAPRIDRQYHRSYDEKIELAKEKLNAFVQETDDLASAPDATTGFRIYAAATYGVRKIAGNTINAVMSIPQLATSKTMVPDLINAVRNPAQTGASAAKHFGQLSTADKMVATAEVLLGGGDLVAGLATRIPRAGAYLGGEIGVSSAHGVTLSANGKLYGFTSEGLPKMGGPLGRQRGAIATVHFGEIESSVAYAGANSVGRTATYTGDVYAADFVGPVEWKYFYRGDTTARTEFLSSMAQERGMPATTEFLNSRSTGQLDDIFAEHGIGSQGMPTIGVSQNKQVAEYFARGPGQNQNGFVTTFRLESRDAATLARANYENPMSFFEVNPLIGLPEQEFLFAPNIPKKFIVNQVPVGPK